MIRTKVTKEEFIDKTKRRIKARNTIMEFVDNVFFPMMATKFDGKVLNVRFVKALSEEAKKINEQMWVREGYNRGEIEIQLLLDKWNYNDYEQIVLKCITNEDGRIDYEASVNDDLNNAWIANFKESTEEHQTAIDNYDECMKALAALDDAVNKYNKLPYVFRRDVDRNYINIY
jgi:hypothetical protein